MLPIPMDVSTKEVINFFIVLKSLKLILALYF
jgi:hypothetical protein